MSLPPGTSGSRTLLTDEEYRFWSHVRRDGDCLVTDLHRSKWGYTAIEIRGKKVKSHRWSWAFFFGPLTSDQHLDHICRNPTCVNPAHLRILDDRTNILIGNGTGAVNARKTHCVHGHPFSKENTLVNRNGFRTCRTCSRDGVRRRYKAVGRFNSRKTHCAHGHEFSPDNTHITPEGWRRCTTCSKEQNRRDLARRREKYHHDKQLHQ